MSDIESDWEGDDELAGRPYGGRPYGGRPYGGRPYGGKPYGGKPYGGKPYGGKPYGGKPYGGKPYGGKPYGGKPYGGKPYGGKPYGGRPYGGKLYGPDDDGPFDPEEWAADIVELVCDYSAAIQAGSSLVFGGSEVQVPVVAAAAAFRVPGAAAPAPVPAAEIALIPGEWELGVSISVPVGLVAGIAARPDLVAALKGDLAEALAEGLDQAALVGAPAGGPGPQGIENRVVATPAPAAGANEVLQWMRDIADGVLANNPPRDPSWILTPAALTTIAQFQTADGLTETAPGGRTVDTYRLLEYDGTGGGVLLGYPFVTTSANAGGMGAYFSSDWREALVGLDPTAVRVGVQGGAAAGVVDIAATMPLDFNLRTPGRFAWA